jgi:hypothetical protein
VKNTKHLNSTASKFNILRQVCNHIPTHLTSQLARKHHSAADARTFSHWSHVVSLIYAKLTHSFGLNDVCDALELHSGPLASLRGASPPKRNTLSHANRERPAAIAEDLFWGTLEHLRQQAPGFGGRRFPGKLRKLKGTIHLLDSTVIELVANCLDWAAHRRRKAAAKCHVRLNFQSLLPGFVVVDVAREHDNVRALEATASLKKGEILIVDRGYVDLTHFAYWSERGVIWVTRWKEGLRYEVLDRRPVKTGGKVLADEWIVLSNGVAARRITALVEVDGKEREMVFLTNQLEWSAQTIVALYQARWEIELFFKQMKPTLKLCDLMSYSANGIRWQVWIALLVQLVMRYLAWASGWSHSFVRLYALVRSILWRKLDVITVLKRYGTAHGSYRNLAQPEQAFLPGLS